MGLSGNVSPGAWQSCSDFSSHLIQRFVQSGVFPRVVLRGVGGPWRGGGWQIGGMGVVRPVRLPPHPGWPGTQTQGKVPRKAPRKSQVPTEPMRPLSTTLVLGADLPLRTPTHPTELQRYLTRYCTQVSCRVPPHVPHDVPLHVPSHIPSRALLGLVYLPILRTLGTVESRLTSTVQGRRLLCKVLVFHTVLVQALTTGLPTSS